MKNGFRKLEEILRKHNLRTSGAIGTVLSNGRNIESFLDRIGYNIERGLENPTYDYIVMGESQVSLSNIKLALSRLNSNGILIARADREWNIIKKGTN